MEQDGTQEEKWEDEELQCRKEKMENTASLFNLISFYVFSFLYTSTSTRAIARVNNGYNIVEMRE